MENVTGSDSKGFRKPHVAYVLLWYPVFTQPFIFREVQGLKAQGYPVEIYSLYGLSLDECSEKMRQAANATICLGMKALFPLLGTALQQLVRQPMQTLRMCRKVLNYHWPNWEMLGENFWALLCGIYLAKRFREAGIDHIHAPWPRGTATAAWVASRLSGIPFSTAARGDNLNPMDPDLLDKLRAACCIRANNKADAERIRKLLPATEQTKICLVYNSLTLPADELAPAPLQAPVRILAVGRFDITKGFDYLLDACKLLKDEGLAFHLTLVGGGGRWLGLGLLGPQLQKQCEDLGLSDCVTMPGLVSHTKLPEVLTSHDIFVAPCIIHASGRRDGIPNTVIEAMAYGLPTVSTNINALPEIVRHGHTGLTVPEKDSAALARALRYMVEHPEDARRMGKNGSVLVREMFNPDTNIRLLINMFTSV
ncbi:MAG: glycosyltransferase family 4 protein [Desulfovibrionaceae bacterium]